MPTQTFNATSTWVCPAGIRWVLAECWGGGGAGGGATTSSNGGGGGAGGAYARKLCPVVAGTTYTVTVAAAKTGSTTIGPQGDPSWFNTSGTVFAEGGQGGPLNNAGTLASGSSAASIGDRVQKGGNGAVGSATISGAGGGGAGSFGDGGSATTGTAGTGSVEQGGAGGAGVGTANTVGNIGNAAGGGASGGYRSNASRAGGNGGAGRVILTWDFQQFQNYLGCSGGSGMSVGEKIR